MKVHIHSELLRFYTYLLSKFGNVGISIATYRTKSCRLNSSFIQSDLQIVGCRKYRVRLVATTLERLSPCGIQDSREKRRTSQIPASRANISQLLHLIINNPFVPKTPFAKMTGGRSRVIVRNKFVTL